MDSVQILCLSFGILLFVLFIWNILSFIFSSFTEIIGQWIENFKISRSLRVPLLQEKYESLLLSKFSYYSKLSEKSKIKFLLRLHRFIRTKQISGRESLEVTDEMKILISASAIQLTFGLDYYWLNHYEQIVLFPDIFHNPRSDEYHKGETSAGGRVVLSWKHFLEGYNNTTDKLNLGLHELAHALDLSRIVNDSDTYFKEYFNKWYLVSKEQFDSMQSGPSFLRDYAKVNFREFFAVCVEHFFEAPVDFQKNLPDIYKHLTKLLRQDPLLTIEQYELALEQNGNTIPFENFNQSPLFSSKITLWHSLVTVGTLFLRTIATFIILFFALKNHLYLVVTIMLALVYFFNALLFTKFELFEQHLVIKRPLFFNRMYCFAFENIISFELNHNNADNVSILYFNKGLIEKFNALCSISKDDEDQLLSFLSEKNIITKSGVS